MIRPRKADHVTHVHLEDAKRGKDRHFIVEYDTDGAVLCIKERKQKEKPQVGVYDTSYWVARSHPLGTGDTMPKRIIAAALAKHAAL